MIFSQNNQEYSCIIRMTTTQILILSTCYLLYYVICIVYCYQIINFLSKDFKIFNFLRLIVFFQNY